MIYFFIIFIILNLLVFGLDRYFYKTLTRVLEVQGLESVGVLRSLGFYNRSIFSNRVYGLGLSLLVLFLIYGLHRMARARKKKELGRKIADLEEDLIRINRGDYSIEIQEDDEYSCLRDQVYKIIVNLKSLEEEARRQKISLKRDLSNIAHQLKTPLTSIGFMLELIEDDRGNMDLYLGKLEGEVAKLRDFTDLVLKLSRINYNALEYKDIDLSLLEIVEDIVGSLNRPVKVEYRGEDLFIRGDEVWIYQAFLNIIKNSLDHTREVLVIEFESNPIYQLVRIIDDGEGLDEEVIKRIFDRFYRGETSLPGYGIGLNLAKSVIEDHHGQIRAFNNEGLTFEIKFYNVT